MAIRITDADHLGRRFGYRFCRSCNQEHSFGTIYPDGTVDVQFPDEFGLEEETTHYRLFGGDAARQRAEIYAEQNGLTVYELGVEAPFEAFGLDCWGRREEDGIVYSYVAAEGGRR